MERLFVNKSKKIPCSQKSSKIHYKIKKIKNIDILYLKKTRS